MRQTIKITALFRVQHDPSVGILLPALTAFCLPTASVPALGPTYFIMSTWVIAAGAWSWPFGVHVKSNLTIGGAIPPFPFHALVPKARGQRRSLCGIFLFWVEATTEREYGSKKRSHFSRPSLKIWHCCAGKFVACFIQLRLLKLMHCWWLRCGLNKKWRQSRAAMPRLIQPRLWKSPARSYGTVTWLVGAVASHSFVLASNAPALIQCFENWHKAKVLNYFTNHCTYINL